MNFLKIQTIVLPAVIVALSLVITKSPVIAMDQFEIQVYDAEINKPRQWGLELHSNYVARGAANPAFKGQITSDEMTHFTLEGSYGVNESLELGGYFQAAVTGDQTHYGGIKLRSKFVLPRKRTGYYHLGINIEISKVPTSFEENEWSVEVRPILGIETARWMLSFNPIIGWALSGDTHPVPEFNPAAKISYKTGMGFMTGVEYYGGLGILDKVPALKNQEHLVFLTGDLEDGPIELNMGVGYGLTEASNKWTLKLIIGKAF